MVKANYYGRSFQKKKKKIKVKVNYHGRIFQKEKKRKKRGVGKGGGRYEVLVFHTQILFELKHS